MGQGSLKGGAASGVGGALREDVFLLQLKRLALTRDMGFFYLDTTSFLRAAGKHGRLLACCHLFLH